MWAGYLDLVGVQVVALTDLEVKSEPQCGPVDSVLVGLFVERFQKKPHHVLEWGQTKQM